MLAYRGVLLGITGGSTIAPVSDNFVFIGQGYLPRIAGDTLAVVLFVLLAATHGAIGLRVVAGEWTSLRGRSLDALMLAAGAILTLLGARAVYAVVAA